MLPASFPVNGTFLRQWIHTHERAFRGVFLFAASPAQLGLGRGSQWPLERKKYPGVPSSKGTFSNYFRQVNMLTLPNSAKLGEFLTALQAAAAAHPGSLKCMIHPDETRSTDNFPLGRGLEAANTSSSGEQRAVDRFMPLKCARWSFHRDEPLTVVSVFASPFALLANKPLQPDAYAAPDVFLQHISVRGLVARTDGGAMAAHCLPAMSWGVEGLKDWNDTWVDCG